MLNVSVIKKLLLILPIYFLLATSSTFACGGGDDCEGNYEIDEKFCPQNRLFKQQNGTVRNAVYIMWKYLDLKIGYQYPTLDELSLKDYLNQLSLITGKSASELKLLLLSGKKKEIRQSYAMESLAENNSYRTVINFLTLAKKMISSNDKLMVLVFARDAALHGEIPPSHKNTNINTSDKIGHWLQYIEASRLFHKKQLDDALKIYKRLAMTSTSWVNETSFYMTARIALIKSQDKFDGYDKTLIDKSLLNRSEALFKKYLDLYPKGLYVKSATHMKRRFYWFRQNRSALNDAIIQFFIEARKSNNKLDISRALHEIFQRFDYSLVISGKTKLPVQAPLLVTLLLANTAQLTKYKAAPEDLNSLTQNRLAYIPYPGLYNYVQSRLLNASGLYRRSANLKPIPNNSIFRHAFLSQQLFASKQIKKPKKQLSLLKSLMNLNRIKNHEWEKVKDSIYLHYINNKLSKILLTNNSILGSKVSLYYYFTRMDKKRLLELTFNRTIPQGKVYILGQFLLLTYYSNGQYTEFLAALDKLKTNPAYMFELRKNTKVKSIPTKRSTDFFKIKSSVKSLMANPKDPKALFNIGYFNLYYALYNNTNKISKDYNFGKSGSQLGTYGYSPLRYFEKSLSLLDISKKYDFEDRLLYYLVRCFKNKKKSNIVSCLGEANYLGIRKDRYHWKKWIVRLLKKYPKSKWVRKLPSPIVRKARKLL